MTFEELDACFDKYTDQGFRDWMIENDKLGKIVYAVQAEEADISLAQIMLYNFWTTWNDKTILERNAFAFAADLRYVNFTPIGWTTLG